MSFLRYKASQFFKNGPTQDEKAAITPTDEDAGFGAGIERSLQKKPSRFLRKQNDKPLPNTPPIDPSEVPPLPKDHVFKRSNAVTNSTVKTNSSDSEKLLPPNPTSQTAAPKSQVVTDKESPKTNPVPKKRPNFASLRKSTSRIFHSTPRTHAPPPPKPHQQTPLLPLPFKSLLSSRSPNPSRVVISTISRPVSSTQASPLPSTYTPHVFPFTKPTSAPPPRPPRPGNIDFDLVALSYDGSLRTVLTPRRTSTQTTTSASVSVSASTLPSSGISTSSSSSSSSSTSPPRPAWPLAADFPPDPRRPLPFRDSTGSVRGYGRFSAYIMARGGYSGGGGYGYGYDGVEAVERECGPVEMYCQERCADWRFEGRGMGEGRERGMLFRDFKGGWQFVGDV